MLIKIVHYTFENSEKLFRFYEGCRRTTTPQLSNSGLEKHKIGSWSFDKGFWHKDNWGLLKDKVSKLVMPKKGKRNLAQEAEETDRGYVRLRMKHNAIESNINELEHRGLDRCPDRGYDHFKRYIGLAVGAYNLRRIGKRLLEEQRLAA